MSGEMGSRGGVAAGFCCVQDGVGGRPCVHLREVALAVAAEEARARAVSLSRMGFSGLRDAAHDGDTGPAVEEALAVLLGPVFEDEGANPEPMGPDPLGEEWVSAPVPQGAVRADRAADQSSDDRTGAAAISDADPDATTATTTATDTATTDAARAAVDVEGQVVGWSRAMGRSLIEVFAQVQERSGRELGVSLATLGAAPAGPVLAALLAGVDQGQIDRFAALEVLAGFKRLEAWAAGAAAKTASVLAEKATAFSHPSLPEKVHASGEEIAMRLGIGRAEANKMIRTGHGLTRAFTETGAALAAGVIDYRKAETIVATWACQMVCVSDGS